MTAIITWHFRPSKGTYKGMEECHAIHATKISNAIMKCSGMCDETYKELIGTEEIVENNDKGGEFLPSTQVLSYYLAALEYGTSALL